MVFSLLERKIIRTQNRENWHIMNIDWMMKKLLK